MNTRIKSSKAHSRESGRKDSPSVLNKFTYSICAFVNVNRINSTLPFWKHLVLSFLYYWSVCLGSVFVLKYFSWRLSRTRARRVDDGVRQIQQWIHCVSFRCRPLYFAANYVKQRTINTAIEQHWFSVECDRFLWICVFQVSDPDVFNSGTYKMDDSST